MGLISYTKPEVGDARTAASVNSITDAISTQSTNVQSVNIATGGVEERNLVAYASRRTDSVSKASVSGALSNTSFATLVIGGTTMAFDFGTSWGADVTLTDQDAIRVYAAFEGSGMTKPVTMGLAKDIGAGIVDLANTERSAHLGIRCLSTVGWIQPAAGASETVERVYIRSKLTAAGAYKAGYAFLVVTLFRKIGRLS